MAETHDICCARTHPAVMYASTTKVVATPYAIVLFERMRKDTFGYTEQGVDCISKAGEGLRPEPVHRARFMRPSENGYRPRKLRHPRSPAVVDAVGRQGTGSALWRDFASGDLRKATATFPALLFSTDWRK